MKRSVMTCIDAVDFERLSYLLSVLVSQDASITSASEDDFGELGLIGMWKSSRAKLLNDLVMNVDLDVGLDGGDRVTV